MVLALDMPTQPNGTAAYIAVDKISENGILDAIWVHIQRTNVNKTRDLADKLFSAKLVIPYEIWD